MASVPSSVSPLSSSAPSTRTLYPSGRGWAGSYAQLDAVHLQTWLMHGSYRAQSTAVGLAIVLVPLGWTSTISHRAQPSSVLYVLSAGMETQMLISGFSGNG